MYVRLQRDSGNGDARLPSKNTMIQKLKQERKRIQDDFLKVKKDADINELLDLAEQKYAKVCKVLTQKSPGKKNVMTFSQYIRNFRKPCPS